MPDPSDFQHGHFAHCESGVLVNLFNYHGISLSESLIFGLGSGLFFCYLPFIKVQGMPMTSFRSYPTGIIRKSAKRLGIKMKIVRFNNRGRAMAALDELLARGQPVGLQAGIYWLPYIPPALRFHFNGHNLVVYGKADGHYFVSDPVVDRPVTCSPDDLMRARFAEGPLAPGGKMYYPVEVPPGPDLGPALAKAIIDTRHRMTHIPLKMFGVSGIRYLARQIEQWPRKFGERRARQMLAWIIRMQEEIGTGGAGFRFMFAAFLQEAAKMLQKEALDEISEKVTADGDRWREFALSAARILKRKIDPASGYAQARDILMDCAAREQDIFTSLKKAGF
ncbi:MAG: BtrH N-terminal domain-containing protein [Deltaproteobacteria bacterium]|nr:BtrH N-terminal domain-containing protein [Deltaproteobacteria bacterium]